jgi:putative addiction module component (TIGR02574 family)
MSQQLPEQASQLLRMPLTIKQRLELIGELWDSLPDSVDELPVPEWHKAELDRRLAAADADPDAGIPWEDVKERAVNAFDNNDVHTRHLPERVRQRMRVRFRSRLLTPPVGCHTTAGCFRSKDDWEHYDFPRQRVR